MSTPAGGRSALLDRPRAGRSASPVDTGRSALSIPAPRRTSPGIPQQRQSASRGRAAANAYLRRDQRLRRLAAVDPRAAARAGRTPFVVLVMALLTVGLVATLWLSTTAAADSYRLQEVRGEVAELRVQSEQLRREVTTLRSPTALAQRAEELGMVPARDAARIVVDEHGAVTVVGRPVPVTPPPRPDPNATQHDAAPDANADAPDEPDTAGAGGNPIDRSEATAATD